MLEKYIISGGNKKIFDENSKEFNVNMTKQIRTLHRKKCNCQYAKSMNDFIPFNSLEEVEDFEKLHNVTFGRCGNCFKQGRK